MKTKKIRVLIIEDNNNFRSSLKRQIAATYPMAICEEATNELEAINKITLLTPDIIFSDISISTGNGFDIIRSARKLCPNALIISMTHENNPEDERAAINCGASYNIPIIKMNVVDRLHPQSIESVPESGINQRRSKRFKSTDVIYVNLRSKSGEQWGKLLDISEGGLALSYFESDLKDGEYADLSIFPSNDEFSIENIKFRTICDLEMATLEEKNAKSIRRRGIQFENLSSIQEDGLNYFLENYTA